MNNDLISREALKKELYDFLSENSTTCDWDDIFDVIDNAKTPTEGDCISRELLKKDIDAQISDFNELNKKGEPYKEFKDIRAILFGLFIGKNLIDNAPTAEHSLLPLSGEADNAYMRGYEVGKAEGILKAETRPKGEWKTIKGIDGDEYYECSNCDEPWVLMAGTPKDNNMNFCPNCGADMRGGAKNECDCK